MDKRLVENEILLPKVAELIASGHTVTLLVKGQSMNPFLRNARDHVTLAPFTSEQLQPGVVVLARELEQERIVLHRIIWREGERLTLQGDGNVKGAEQTTVDRVMGLVIEVIRGRRHYDTLGRTWRYYSYCWKILRPVRHWLLALYRRAFGG